jgi:hypothetical protein
LRNRYPAIAKGSYDAPAVAGQVMSFQRRLGDEISVVVINYSTQQQAVMMRDLPAGTSLTQVFPAGAAAQLSIAADGSAKLEIGPQSVRVFASKVRP